MNLFQGVLVEMSKAKGRITFNTIAIAIGKSEMSVKAEVGRLKKTTWFGNWMSVDWARDEVSLQRQLRGCRLETLEFLVKQFYNKDRINGKGIHDTSTRLDLNEVVTNFEQVIKQGIMEV